MDNRCRIRVFFDVEATNRIEKATGERVTSYLRSLVYLKEYKFVILPPSDASRSEKDYRKSRHQKNPELVLHVYDWQKYIGSSDDPLYHEEAKYLLSNFLSYSVDGIDGRVPKGFGAPVDEAIWRKQENEVLAFLRTEWGKLQPSVAPEATTVAKESTGEHPLEAPYRHVLMDMLRSMNPEKEKVVESITVFGINPLEELDMAEIAKVLLDNSIHVIADEPKVDSPPEKVPQTSKIVLRKRACRKSTGRKTPRARRSSTTAAPPPAMLETQPLLTQLPATQRQDIESIPKSENDLSRHESSPPETVKVRKDLPNEKVALLKQMWERDKPLILYPQDQSEETPVPSSGLNPLLKCSSPLCVQQDGTLNQATKNNMAKESTSRKRLQNLELKTGRSRSTRHGRMESPSFAARENKSNRGDILPDPASSPNHNVSSSLDIRHRHMSEPQAHVLAASIREETLSPVPYPSSQKVINNERDEEDSDEEMVDFQISQVKDSHASRQCLLELDDDEDGLYDFEIR
ncbi:hypothetical protein QFC19_008348 [Naganishia cerealis]|nr:hypothetical protein QFC19_008348 [Naganishia cerealis]